MYLHVENNEVILCKNIIGVFNIENIQLNKEIEKNLSSIKDKLNKYKTYILTCEKGESKKYFSNISSGTIQKRIQNMNSI